MLSHGNAHAFNFSYLVDLPTFLLPKDGILVGFQHFLSVKLPVFICCGIKLKRKKKLTHLFMQNIFLPSISIHALFRQQLPNEKVNSYYYCYYFTILGGATNQKGETKKKMNNFCF